MPLSPHYGLLAGVLVLLGSALSIDSASAQTIVPISGTYTGTVTIIGQQPGTPPLIEFISDAIDENSDASFTLNSYDSHGLLDMISGVATGQNAFVSDDGNATLFGTFTQFNVFNADPTQPSTFTGTEVFTDGGGIFDGTSGSATFFGTFAQDPIDPTVADFTITFNGSASAVPEPNAFALFGTACVAGSALLARRRRFRPSLLSMA